MAVTPLDGRRAVAAATGGRGRAATPPLNRAGLYRLAAVAARLLPRGRRLSLAAGLAARAAAWLPAHRAAVAANLARVVPDAAPDARARLVVDVFRHFGMCFADLVLLVSRERALDRLLATVEGADHIDAAAGSGRGLVVLTAHLGNWELGGRLLARRLGRPTHVVVAPDADPRVERFLRDRRASVTFVVRRDARIGLALVTALRRGGVVAMQGDRAIGGPGDQAISFFGAAARFPIGPFVLARAAGVAVVPVFCVLGPDRRYRVLIRAPIDVRRTGELQALAAWVAVLEQAVRAHPAQWFNFFDAWEATAD